METHEHSNCFFYKHREKHLDIKIAKQLSKQSKQNKK